MAESMYRQILQMRADLYNETLEKGMYTPYVLPYDLLPVLCLALGVVATPRLPRNVAVVTRWVLTICSFTYMILRWPYARTIGLAAGYGLGLSAFWGMIMTVNLLLLHDPGKDFQRIEVRQDKKSNLQDDATNGQPAATRSDVSRKRLIGVKADQKRPNMLNGNLIRDEVFIWQGQPKGGWHLLEWSADLITAFRGINWNFRIPIRNDLAPPPRGNPPVYEGNARKVNKTARRAIQRSALFSFLQYYVILDLLKTCMVSDPYLLGFADLDSPTRWEWLAQLNEDIPIATRFVRLSLSLMGVVSALTFIFSLNPLFFGTILPYLLGDKLYDITKNPLRDAWMYPPQWGSMFSTLCNRGLGGMWGTWWHQMFRYGISEPARILMLKLGINPKSQTGRTLQLFMAFGLTAAIHAVASSTTFSVVPSKPSGPFIFFMSQAVGITVQTELAKVLTKSISLPKLIRQIGNFMFVLVFLWFTGPFLSDDFARCGIWLFEPVPISIFRGLGFGPADCWIPWLQFPDGGGWMGLWNQGYLKGVAIF